MKRVVIGVGNPVRGDDAAGVEVASRLTRTRALVHRTGGFEMIELWEDADEVIVADAIRSGAPPGTIHLIDASSEPIPPWNIPATTHSTGVAETIELARSLGRLPKRVLIYGIEVGELTPGGGMTPEVARAVSAVVEDIENA